MLDVGVNLAYRLKRVMSGLFTIKSKGTTKTKIAHFEKSEHKIYVTLFSALTLTKKKKGTTITKICCTALKL